MCLTSAPIELSNTIIYAAEVLRNGVPVHVLGYQNRLKHGTGGPNAMLLPIPAAAPLSPKNLLDTKALRLEKVLDTYAMLVQPRSRTLTKSVSREPESTYVFESGPYTVVLAPDAGQMYRALEKVPERKRPNLSAALVAKLSILYQGYHFALCCFDESEFRRGESSPPPVFWWYSPQDPDQLFAPAIDAHDGGPPKAGPVRRDHTLIFGTHTKVGSHDTARLFAQVDPSAAWILTGTFSGGNFRSETLNGDFVFPTSLLRASPHYAESGIRVQVPKGL